jgi:lipoprotein-anchoring transpeptidase ErfK/SrfK
MYFDRTFIASCPRKIWLSLMLVASLQLPQRAAAAAVQVESLTLSNYEAGTVVVRTSERRLYYVLENGRALSYPVAVGKGGKTWAGVAHIDGKYLNPAWSPPAEIRRDKPNLPSVIPGGSPHNPMGVAALTLTPGDYAIHGTNAPNSIGRYASYGCIRMFNRDIIDLYRRVTVGAKVVVLK